MFWKDPVNFPASANWMLVAPFYTKLHPPCWCINLAKRVTFKLPRRPKRLLRRTKQGGDFKVYAFLHSSSSSSQELFLLKTCILLKLKTSSDLNLQAPAFLCYKNSKICVAALTWQWHSLMNLNSRYILDVKILWGLQYTDSQKLRLLLRVLCGKSLKLSLPFVVVYVRESLPRRGTW